MLKSYIIFQLRTLIKKIKAFPQQQEKFEAQCRVANVPNLNIILDVRTIWNLTYNMLMRARVLKEVSLFYYFNFYFY